MTTQIVMASTLFAAAGAAAAIDEGAYGRPDRRLLLAVNSAPVPEIAPALESIPGASAALGRFDGIVRLNDAVAPEHPHSWQPRESDDPIVERLLRSYWGIGDDDVELVLESIAIPPAAWLARVFVGADIVVHADGLMTFGPTRREVPHRVAGRVREVRYLDLVPGLRPVLLTEHGAGARPVPAEALRRVMAEIADESGAAWEGAVWGGPAADTAVVIGQYLSALGLVSREEEGALHADMVARAAECGAARVAFKPHPSAPPGLLDPLRAAAERHGVELVVLQDNRPVEVLLAAEPPRLLVACFSTALMTARTVFGVDVAAVGTRFVLDRLTPFENSNRIPATIVDAVLRPDGRYRDPQRLQELVDTVAYCMQDWRLRALRPRAVEVLGRLPEAERRRYVTRRRLARLGLPGRPRTPGSFARRAITRLRLRDHLERVDLASGGLLRRIARRVR